MSYDITSEYSDSIYVCRFIIFLAKFFSRILSVRKRKNPLARIYLSISRYTTRIGRKFRVSWPHVGSNGVVLFRSIFERVFSSFFAFLFIEITMPVVACIIFYRNTS